MNMLLQEKKCIIFCFSEESTKHWTHAQWIMSAVPGSCRLLFQLPAFISVRAFRWRAGGSVDEWWVQCITFIYTTENYKSICCSGRWVLWFTHSQISVWMTELCRQSPAQPCWFQRRIPTCFHWGGCSVGGCGWSVTCYTLNMGVTCLMLQMVKLAFNRTRESGVILLSTLCGQVLLIKYVVEQDHKYFGR